MALAHLKARYAKKYFNGKPLGRDSFMWVGKQL